MCEDFPCCGHDDPTDCAMSKLSSIPDDELDLWLNGNDAAELRALAYGVKVQIRDAIYALTTIRVAMDHEQDGMPLISAAPADIARVREAMRKMEPGSKQQQRTRYLLGLITTAAVVTTGHTTSRDALLGLADAASRTLDDIKAESE